MPRPEPGTLPLRGDIAHIALADRYLVPHYAVPQLRQIAGADTALRLAPDGAAESVALLPADTAFEALDYAGAWCWGCLGPQGPSGWVETASLEPLEP